jgi:hypothetical protein
MTPDFARIVSQQARVMRGLDPRIHDELRQQQHCVFVLQSLMDCRVIGVRKHAVLRTAMPGNDAEVGANLVLT